MWSGNGHSVSTEKPPHEHTASEVVRKNKIVDQQKADLNIGLSGEAKPTRACLCTVGLRQQSWQ